MGTIAKGARCYGAIGVLAVALWDRGQCGDRGGVSKIIPPGPAPTGVAVRSTAPPRRRSPAPWSRSTCRSRLGMLDMGSMSNTTRYGVLIAKVKIDLIEN